MLRGAVGAEIGRDAARHDAVHHQPMAEAGVRGAQHALAQDAAMRMHEREGGVVADGADVAEMIGEPLELGHQRAQIDARAAGPSISSAASTARAKASA